MLQEQVKSGEGGQQGAVFYERFPCHSFSGSNIPRGRMSLM